jgi:hypothetical protein
MTTTITEATTLTHTTNPKTRLIRWHRTNEGMIASLHLHLLTSE